MTIKDVKFILLFFSVVLVFVMIFHFSTRKYLNPYKLTMIFGKKGCGKTTLLTKLALQYQKKGIPVYSTEPIQGCYIIKPDDIGFYTIPENSVLLIDEVGMIWDNRKHKEFKTEVRDWFKLQRHHKVKVYLFSQAFDIDKKLRDLTDDMYLVEKKFRVFSYSKRIMKKVVLNESTAESSSKLDENLMFDSLLMFWAGSRKFTFIPKYIKYFDSFSIHQLLDKEFEFIPLLEPKESNPRFNIKCLSSIFSNSRSSSKGGQ